MEHTTRARMAANGTSSAWLFTILSIALCAVAAGSGVLADRDQEFPRRGPAREAYEEHCAFDGAKIVVCVNNTHYKLARCSKEHGPNFGGQHKPEHPQSCPSGHQCKPLSAHEPGGAASCRAASTPTMGTMQMHLQRAVGFQLIEQVAASEAAQCSDNATRDAEEGKILCQALHGAAALTPTFVHELGNTWATFPGPNGSFAGCAFQTPQQWRICVGANIKRIAALTVAASPGALISAGLMEFLDSRNLDPGQQDLFPHQCCVPGTVGQWGGNTTCVPDVTTVCAQQYYLAWSKVFVDAGVRALFFGQARLTGGGRGCSPNRTGCSRVSTSGAAGFAKVIQAALQYAESRGYGKLYFGPQAASGLQLASGTELATWVYGGQHLFSRAGFLVQPFGINGSEPALGPQWYGAADLHDANLVNNDNGLPVLLDFDNFSGEEDKPDDIRRLSSWPNATRPALVRTLWRLLRYYNPRATLEIPMSKAAGGNWPGWKQPQSQCYSSGEDGVLFGAYSCNIVSAAADMFAEDPYQPLTNSSVDVLHVGIAMQSPDLTAVAAFNMLLGRQFKNEQEYAGQVALLPGLVLGARGARCDFASRVLASDEFRASACSRNPTCLQARLSNFLCLGSAACIRGSANLSDPEALCRSADSLGLFGNAALMDPAWCLGCQ